MNEHLLSRTISQDIEWLVNAPSLLAPHCLLWQPNVLNSLNFQELNLTKAELAQCQTRKLGLYFETLAGLLFDRHPRYEILAKNRAMMKHKVTLGELDLLLRDTLTNEVLHLELALKFYLYVNDVEPSNMAWIGSGLKDFLHQKLNRLLHHQLRLPDIAKTENVWPSDLPFPDRHAVWLPGRLYLPHNKAHDDIDHGLISGTPWSINPNVERSVWYENPYSQLPILKSLTKPGWLRGKTFADPPKPIPAQFSHPDHRRPVYVLPVNWQTNAQTALNTYKATL